MSSTTDYKKLYEQSQVEIKKLEEGIQEQSKYISGEHDRQLKKNNEMNGKLMRSVGKLSEQNWEYEKKIERLTEENQRIKTRNEVLGGDWRDDNKKFAVGEYIEPKPRFELEEQVQTYKRYAKSQDNKILRLEKVSNAKTNLIENLFSKIVKDADMDDGICLSKEYGHKYIDEWNITYHKLLDDVIKTINECELDEDNVYLKFHPHDYNNIEFRVKECDAEQAESEWIEEYLSELEERIEDGWNIDGNEDPDYNYKDVMEQDMVNASEDFEEENGFPFPSIEDGNHNDVGVLGDLLENHFKLDKDKWYNNQSDE